MQSYDALPCPSPIVHHSFVHPHPRIYPCLRAETEPPLDGWLDHPEWVRAPWSQEFMDIEGPEHKPQPNLKTRMKMLWNEHGLYIGAEMEEPNLWATLTERDSVIFHDHDFEVFLDPDDDHHQYIELEINALNTVWDLLLPKPYRDEGEAINAFDLVGLRTAVALKGKLNDPSTKDEGWSVAIFIPWTAIAPVSTKAVPPRTGDRWRINFSRVEWDLEVVDGKHRKVPNRPEHNWVWSPQWVVNMHCPEMWGFVEFQDSLQSALPLDPHWEERQRLIAVYEAQKAYQANHKRYAPSAAALGLDFTVNLIPGERQWLAAIVAKDGTRLLMREDSRLSIVPRAD